MAEQDSAPEASPQSSPGESRPGDPGSVRRGPEVPAGGDAGVPDRGRAGKSPAGTGTAESAAGTGTSDSPAGSGTTESAAGTRAGTSAAGTRAGRSAGGVGESSGGTGGRAPSGPGGSKSAAGTGGKRPGGGIGDGTAPADSGGETIPSGTGGAKTRSGIGGRKDPAGAGGKSPFRGSGESPSAPLAGGTAPVPSAPERAPAALVDLVRQGVLDERQLGAVVTALAAEPPRPTPARLLAEIAAYAGAGLLLSGLVLILAESWDDMAKVGRFVLFVLVALGLTVAGVATAGGRPVLFRPAWRRLRAAGHTARTRLAAVLFALAAVSVAAAAGSVFEGGNDTTNLTWVCGAAAGLVAAAVGYAALPSLLGLLVCAGFSVAAVIALLGEVLEIDGDLTGLGVLVLGIGWLALSRLRAVLEVWAGYVVGVVLAVVGAQTVDVSDQMRLAYVLTAVVSVACFALYATDRSWVLSLGGAAALTLAAVEAVADWTGESAGASGAILVVGAVVLGIGSYLLTRSAKNSGQV